MSLFRKEAVDYQRERLWGEVILTQSLSSGVFSLLIGLVLIGLTVYLIFGTYTRKETVNGYLVPTEGLVRVHAPRSGTVSGLSVQPGDHVAKGDVLMQVQAGRVLADGVTLDVLLVELLDQQKKQLQGRIERHKHRKAARRNYLVAKIRGIEMQIEQLKRQKTLQNERLALLASRYQSLEGLHREALISQEDYEARFQNLLDERQRKEQLSQSLLAEEARLADVRFELGSLESDTRETLDQLASEIKMIDQQRLQHRGEYAFSIKAPAEGRVTSLQVSPGQMVETQRPLLAILPENNHLQAELFVPTRAIGFIEPALPVRIRYDAFPYERFGIHESHIRQVAGSILAPHEVEAPIRLDMPVYRVTSALGEQALRAYGREMPLQAGMTLEADILLDKRPLYQWILRPLFSLKGTL